MASTMLRKQISDNMPSQVGHLRHSGRIATIFAYCSLLAACSSTSASFSDASYGVAAQTMTICSGYGCVIKDKLTYPDSVKAELQQIMAPGEASPEAERVVLAKAIARMETASRDQLRYTGDVEFSYQKNSGKRGQMDCIDESLNTTSYLKYLYANGMLRHHTPLPRFAERGLLIDGRYPHKSARMRQIGGVDWAVDSWKQKNGGEPEIIPLAEWYKGRNQASQY